MIKLNTILGVILAFAGIPALAQEKIVLNVIYEFRYVRDLSRENEPYNAIMVLSLGKNSSRYCSEKLYSENDKNAILEKQKQQKQIGMSSKPITTVSGGPLLKINNNGAIINEEIVKDLEQKQLTLNAHIAFKTYKVDLAIPKITWEIQKEKKTIGRYVCQKATGEYAGRVYEAWFSPELPFQDGPWKLSGLPGLILEARDQKNEVSFLFKELSRNTDSEETTKSFLNSQFSIKANSKSYKQIKMAYEMDPQAVTSAMAPNATLAIINIESPENKVAKKIKKYNPIELN